MAGKNDKPVVSRKGAPGKATKQSAKAPAPKDHVDQVSTAGQKSQGEATGALEAMELSQLQSAALLSSTGNQGQPGAPEAGSAAASVLVQPGAGQNCFADSSPTSIPGLAVTSSRDGFWRCGRQWSKAEQLVALADLTEEEFDLICNEPLLTVTYVDLAPQVKESA